MHHVRPLHLKNTLGNLGLSVRMLVCYLVCQMQYSVRVVCRQAPISSSVLFTFSTEGKWLRPEVYESELYFKIKEIEELKKEITSPKNHPFSHKQLTTDKLCEHYTGIDRKMFDFLVVLCETLPLKYYHGKPLHALPFTDEVLLTLINLRRNNSHTLIWVYDLEYLHQQHLR